MKKFFISLMIIISIIGVSMQSFAVLEVGQMNVYPKAECEKLLTYNGIPIRTTYIAYNKNGVEYPAYCLDVNLPGAEQGEYVVNASDKIRDINIWKAIINGYPYKSIEELGAANGQEAFTATKQAVYTMIHNRDISSYGPVNSDAGRRTYQIYCNIVNAARNMNANIADNVFVNLNTISEKWEVDNINSNYLSKEYYTTSNVSTGNYEINLQGLIPKNTKIVDKSNHEKKIFAMNEHFKIMIPIQELIESETFSINVKAKLDTKPVMYGASTVPGTQDYALTGFIYEEVGSTISENYKKNETKIIVYKLQEGSTEIMEGVKFELLNENQEILRENLITDEDGKIIIENLLPGKYYLKEIETLEGFEINFETIEIELEFGEEKEITVNNKEIPKKVEPEVNVVPEPNIEYREEVPKKLPRTGF